MSSHPQPPQRPATRPWQVGLVLAVGLVVFVGLLFAPRTVLESQRGASPTADAVALPEDLALLAELPGGPDGQAIRGLLKQLDQAATPSQQQPVLDKLVAASVNAQRYDLAARFQERLLRLAPEADRRDATVKLARLYTQAIDLPEVQQAPQRARQVNAWGLTAWEAVMALEPTSLDAQLEHALLHVRSGDPSRMMSQGILRIRALAEANPTYLRATLELGRFSLQTQQYDKAESRFRTAIESHPERPEPYFYLGQTLALQGRRAEARTALEQALKRTPTGEMARAARAALDTLR